jgi:parallel beta-helix repeat protein
VRLLLRGLPVWLLVVLLALVTSLGSAGAQDAAGAIVGPGESIQKAISAADPGDTIVVSGVHREDVVIRKNGISLRGLDAVIEPPARVGSPCGPSGICILGNVDFDTGKVNEYVKGVSISGFTVKNFRNEGIFAVGARDATFTDNRLINNGEYGAFALASTGTKIISNVARGSDEAGIYVGSSPHANAKVVGNDTYGNFLGVFIRDALEGTITGNRVHNNCLGVLFLADAPGPSGNFEVKGNWVRDNTRSCPATDEAPPLSGVGISLFGARGVEVTGNHIAGNVPTGPTIFSGGVVVKRGLGGTAPRENSVVANNFGRNKPDIFWDGSGPSNRFATNNCNTSVPARLCR